MFVGGTVATAIDPIGVAPGIAGWSIQLRRVEWRL
jgi:hypothetical protein